MGGHKGEGKEKGGRTMTGGDTEREMASIEGEGEHLS